MKAISLSLDNEPEEFRTIGLLRLAKKLPEHEFFYQINRLNQFYFQREEDLKLEGNFSCYFYSKYKAYSRRDKVCLHLFSNRFIIKEKIKDAEDLFGDDDSAASLVREHPDVDYIIATSGPLSDFSVILLPENLTFQIQKFELSSTTELFQILQYHE